MNITHLALIKENKKGKSFQAEGFKVVYRVKGSTSGDNSENLSERIYLVAGKAEATIKGETQVAEAPTEIIIPAKTYHKIVALTDIIFLLFES